MRVSANTGLVTFLGSSGGQGLALAAPTLVAPAAGDAPTPRDRAVARALSFVRAHGAAFGLRSTNDARVDRVELGDVVGMDHVRLRQLWNGVPVTGGEMTVHLRGAQLVAVLARTLPTGDAVDTTPRLAAVEAETAVRELMSRDFQEADPKLAKPVLELFNRGLLEDYDGPTRLAWFVVAESAKRRELVWVDARTGGILLHFNQRPNARQREIHDAAGSADVPGPLVRSEGQPATGVAAVDQTYDYLGNTYDFFAGLGRDSYDGAGATLVATVRSTTPDAVNNAYWDPEIQQMVIGEGMVTDDIVAHELTHAVTERTAGLFYYMQSGALNESYSDIFGETVDVTNGAGNDSAAVRWLLGEDVGAARNMMDPTELDSPGKMSDPQFRCWSLFDDGGGVHFNSGISNHAYALMTDGDGQTITGIGLDKAARIAYRTLTSYLVSGSGFADNYDATLQACSDLVGSAGITTGDCAQVRAALDAVEMRGQPPCSPATPPAPALCATGEPIATLFADDFEAGLSNWTVVTREGAAPWSAEVGFATSGRGFLYGYDPDERTDSAIQMTTDIVVPSNRPRLQFSHAHSFDSSGTSYYDGGVIEYSTDGGASWNDAGSMIVAGATYPGEIAAATDNPLAGRPAFVGETRGYTATQLNLSSLIGQRVRFRFRIASNGGIGYLGWMIDDLRIYQCDGALPALAVNDVTTVEGNEGSHDAVFTVTLSAAASAPVTVNYVTFDGSASAGSDYAATVGTLTFDPGVVTQTVRVPVLGDTVTEEDEYFFLRLGTASGAEIDRGEGRGTIVSDECIVPAIWIEDAVASEGNAGANYLSFRVQLSRKACTQVRFDFTTRAGTATAGDDFVGNSSTLVFSPGTTLMTLVVRLVSDTIAEPDETFEVQLSNPVGATLGRSVATGTIRDDDRPLNVYEVKTWPSGNGILDIIDMSGTLFFNNDDGVHGYELWKTDGTEAGTVLVKDINPAGESRPDGLANLQGTLLFTADDGTHGCELWRSDGTEAGTAMVKDINAGPSSSCSGYRVIGAGDRAYFAADDGVHGQELWVTDGTAAGTAMVADLLPGADGAIHSFVSALALNGAVYFATTDGLWRSDGTQAGTRRLWTGTVGWATLVVGGAVYFQGDDGTSGNELWRTDGTRTALVKDINPGDGSSEPGWMRDVGGVLFFTADDGVHGRELWKSDGTAAGTVLLNDIMPGSGESYPDSLKVVNDVLFFSADDGVHGRELWKSDGTTAGTVLVSDTLPGSGSGVEDFFSFGALAGVLYFKGVAAETGEELWRSDGTASGTRIEADIVPGPGGSIPYAFENAGARLFFECQLFDGMHHLWAMKSPGLTASDAAVAEGDSGASSAVVTVTLDAPVDMPVTVAFATFDGTAVAGSDYQATSGTLTFPAGVTSRTISVPVIGDVTREADETFTVTLTRSVNAAIARGTATVTISNDDDAQPGMVQLSAAKYSAGEAGAFATITVARVDGSVDGVTVDFATSDVTARAGSDYTTVSGTLSFGAGASSQTFSVPILDDHQGEGTETLRLTLSKVTGGATLGRSTAILSIVDDDSELAFGAPSFTATEAGRLATISVKRRGVTSGACSVDYATSDGTAQAGADYTSKEGTLSFASGVLQRTFTVPIINDRQDETDETVLLHLTNLRGAVVDVGGAAVLTIKDDDTGGVVEFAAPSYAVREAGPAATIAVIRRSGLAEAVTVQYATTDGSATMPGDYTRSSGMLTFAAGQTRQTFSVPIVDDTVAEGEESLSINLSNPTGGASLGARSSAPLTIIDNEPIVEFASAAYTVAEGAPAVISVRRLGSLASVAEVAYSTTVGGTATADTDYRPRSGRLRFGRGVASLTFQVPTMPDTLHEGDETVDLALTAASGTVLGGRSAAQLTIRDNDRGGTIQFSAATYSVAEAGRFANITVTRSGGAASGVTVDYGTADGTATGPDDYEAQAGTLTFAAGRVAATFRIPIVSDTSAEGHETVALTLADPTGGATLGARAAATLVVKDDDAPLVQLTVASAAVAEKAGRVILSVARAGGLAQTLTVAYTATDGSAVVGEDYGPAASGTLTFAPGQATRSLSIPIVNDNRDESDETFTVTLANPTAGTVLGWPQSAVLTIRDDDTAGVVAFAAPVVAVGESDRFATITVKRTAGVAEGATIAYATEAGGSATSGVDFVPTSGTLVFAAGQATRTFTIELLGDSEVEGGEQLSLVLSAPGGGASLGSVSRTVVWIVDDDE